MDTKHLLDRIKAERPDLVPAIQILTQSTGAERAAATVVTRHILSMQAAIDEKRTIARRMLMLRTHHLPDHKGEHVAHATRYAPDVLIHYLCQIGECRVLSSANTELIEKLEKQADEMWAKAVATGQWEYP